MADTAEDSQRAPGYILYFASTHWDREWYLPFQSFRFRLVDTIREILDVLERDASFTAFILDGQTVILEDYVEVMPGDAERLGRLIRAGRLRVGPWYTMPDENLVSGESLIRNLAMGRTVASRFAGEAQTLPLGYLCDVFGHVAQMPQILNGFHIRSAVLGRGTNQSRCPAYFVWRAPNGSHCITFKVPESCGYGSFWRDVYAAASEGGNREDLLTNAKRYVEKELRRSPLPYVVLADGMDHERIHPLAPWLTTELAKAYGCRAGIGSVEDLFELLEAEERKLPIRSGELQEPAQALEEHNRLIPGTLSSRYDLKQSNDRTQRLLEKAACPLVALANLRGAGIPLTYFDIAYRYLLQNQAHDSICGCSVGEVHRDMYFRFNQAQRIAGELADTALYCLCGLEAGGPKDAEVQKLTVFNPLPFPVEREAVLPIWLPLSYPCRFDEMVPSEQVDQFLITDADGAEVPYQVEEIRKNTFMRYPRGFYAAPKDRYTVRMHVRLPAMGFASYRVTPSPKPVRYFGSLKTGDLTAENPFLQVRVSADGRVDVTEKQTGRRYPGLIEYKDYGETGDGWTARPPVPDRVVHAAGAVSVETLQNGPVACVFDITRTFSVPAHMEYSRQATRRSAETVPLTVHTRLALAASAPYLEVSVRVENTARDHRLVLSLPTGIESARYTAEQAFAFVERPAGRNPATHDWKEADRPEKSFAHIVCRRRDDGSGFAFISQGGLHECAAQAGCEGRLDITLLRGFEKTFLTDGQPDGELQGPLEYGFLLVPFRAAVTNTDLLRLKERFQTEPYCFTEAAGPDYIPQNGPEGFRWEGNDSAVSLLKPAPDGRMIVRVVNYADRVETGVLRCPSTLCEAHASDLTEVPLDPLPFRQNRLELTLLPHEIKTVLLAFQNGPRH